MEFVNKPNPPIRPLPGFTQAESEELLRKVKKTMADLAQNAKSKRVRGQARKELRERGISYGQETANDCPEPVALESPHRPGSNLFNLLKLPNVPAPKPASQNPST